MLPRATDCRGALPRAQATCQRRHLQFQILANPRALALPSHLGLLLLAGASRRAKGEAHLSEPAAELERQLELIKRELGEARAQQAATSEILKIISRSA